MDIVCVAMSGGIDSSYAAYLLKKWGWRVIGITFELLPDNKKGPKFPDSCCSQAAVERARKVAEDLSIPHYVINLHEEFNKQVIEKFIMEYAKGKTPNPCILCNRDIKFSAFLRKALSFGTTKIATGHYAVIEEKEGNYYLKRGKDRKKDQSYFLYPIPPSFLDRILFPLGNYTKAAVREQSEWLGWEPRNIRESQDICFIPEGQYRDFLSYYIKLREGPIYHVDGTYMGRHKGIHLYTIGQRRGIGIPYKTPLYVVDLIPDENTVIVGTKEHLEKRALTASNLNFFDSQCSNVTAKTRYRQKDIPCTYAINGDALTVHFNAPVSSITPGQSVVLYEGERVVGGGVIDFSYS